MQPQYQMSAQQAATLSLQQNRVLRNTYMLLALTMVPSQAFAIYLIASNA